MAMKRQTAEDLKGKVIDIHSHVGVSLKAYGRLEYPYAQSAEDLSYRQKSAGVDVNVVFPFSPDLHFDLSALVDAGEVLRSTKPISAVPYGIENRLIMREVFDFSPELSGRFLPFVSVDPGRDVEGQLHELSDLEREYPIYGMKIVGVACQSKVIRLLEHPADDLLDFAEKRNIPVLFHTTSTVDDEYSHAADVLKVVAARPGIRFCLAHAIVFHKGYLDEAARLRNAWIDTAAMKIQVDLLNDSIGKALRREDVIDADFTDYRAVMRRLCDMYPSKVLWGTDSPAYTYISRRKQGEGVYRDFRYKGTYEEEVAALNALALPARRRVSSENSLRYLFGGE